VAACADGATDPVVARHMGDFFEAYLGRELTRSELRAVTDEFVGISVQEGKSLDAIHQRAAGFDRHTKILRNGRDGAAQQTARDTVIHANYFRPVMQNTIELQLFLEPDPVRVVDSRSRRLMTERDVVALVNLYRFAETAAGPKHRQLSRAEIERAVKDLNRTVGGTSGRMPQFFTEASAFWSGVQREWSKLSDAEQKLVRAYILKTWRVKMSSDLFRRLWGFETDRAFQRSMQDRNERAFAVTQFQLESAYMPDLMRELRGD
jgi:hypothetical protein